MAKRMTARRIHIMDDWPKGCAKPQGYGDFFEWAEAQELHGLKQEKCPACRRWLFPQEPHPSECTAPNARLGQEE